MMQWKRLILPGAVGAALFFGTVSMSAARSDRTVSSTEAADSHAVAARAVEACQHLLDSESQSPSERLDRCRKLLAGELRPAFVCRGVLAGKVEGPPADLVTRCQQLASEAVDLHPVRACRRVFAAGDASLVPDGLRERCRQILAEEVEAHPRRACRRLLAADPDRVPRDLLERCREKSGQQQAPE